MTRAEERATERVEHANGGTGHLLKEMLLTREQMGEGCRMFARVTLEEGCELGYHEHHGETETYYILSGHGIYNDNGTEIEVGPGDVTFCADGCGHGLKNTGTEEIAFIALILK
ncbi:MAG TPA: cupin domain-containing protein [Lachnospiraceae bacterium]|nr:cupin domain-containing protein [Lachnospiraceae bacterium]